MVGFVGLGSTIGIGLMADWKAIPDVDLLASDIAARFAALSAATGCVSSQGLSKPELIPPKS
jgi:hypothetical protein